MKKATTKPKKQQRVDKLVADLTEIDEYVGQWAKTKASEGLSRKEIRSELRSLCQKAGREPKE